MAAPLFVRFGVCVAAALFLFAAPRTLSVVAVPVAPVKLFSPAPFLPDTGGNPSPSPYANRTLVLAADPAALGFAEALQLDLFGSTFVAAKNNKAGGYAGTDGATSWYGTLHAKGISSVVFVSRGGMLAGIIRMQDKVFEIEPLGDNLVSVVEVDWRRFPKASEPLLPPAQKKLAAAGPEAQKAEYLASRQYAEQLVKRANDFYEITVLVLYSNAALGKAGGLQQLLAKIDLVVAETNLAYVNSEIHLRVKVVAIAEAKGFKESGDWGTDLNLLTGIGDGVLEEAHTLRDQHAADFVSLFTGIGCGGVGWVMPVPSVSSSGSAFNLIAVECAVSGMVFAHELGHNLGAIHDRGSGGSGLFPYSYGWQDLQFRWRTIMAYGCPGRECPTVPYFSNPRVLRDGVPMGSPEGQPDEADVAKTFNKVAAIAASYREKNACVSLSVAHRCVNSVR